MSVKDNDAALLTQSKEENAGRRKTGRKDGLIFELSDYSIILQRYIENSARHLPQTVAATGQAKKPTQWF